MNDRAYTVAEFVTGDSGTTRLFHDEQFAYVNRRWPEAVWNDCPSCEMPMTVTDTNHGPHCFACGWWERPAGNRVR